MNDTSLTVIVVFGLLCITVLECVALIQGIDGQILSIVVGAITTIVGYAFGVKTAQKQ